MSDIPKKPLAHCSIYSMDEQDWWDRERDRNSRYQASGSRREDGRHLDEDGTWKWYKDGCVHRDDGPAVLTKRKHPETDVDEYVHIWVRHGDVHRLDGPAIVFSDGTLEWFVNGKQINPHGMRIMKDFPWFESHVDHMIWLNLVAKHQEERADLNSQSRGRILRKGRVI